MKGRYYNIEVVYDGKTLPIKLMLWNIDEWDGFKTRMNERYHGEDVINQFIIDAITTQGFVCPVEYIAIDYPDRSIAYALLKANNRWVDKVFLGIADTSNCYLQSKNGIMDSGDMRLLFTFAFPMALFINDDFTVGRRGGLDYQVGTAPVTVDARDRTWEAVPRFTNTLISAGLLSRLKDFLANITPVEYDSDNPLSPIDPSGPGDGEGAFDDTSDFIGDSSLPTLSSANTGFTRIYNPTLSQVQDLARYLWTDETLIETLWNKIKQYFEDPMQAIIGFNLVPVPVPDAGSKNFALMYIDTGVSMNVAASQFVDRDCGTLTIEPYYGSALDYSPYTKVSAFLPYIGNVQLNVDEVMGHTLQVKYRVDICSGSCVAKILVDGNVLYQYSGHCAINIPFAASDFSSYVQAAISVAKLGVAAAVAAAGGPPPVGVMDPSQQTNQVVTTTQTTETARNPTTGRQITTGTRTTIETREAPATQGSTQASFSALSPANISNTVGQIMSSKPVVNHSGSFSGNTGYLGVRRPYLIIERPNLCMPKNFQNMNGYPSMITMELSTCKGYTRVQQVQLTGLTATNPEQAEIQELLKSGVIF